MPDWRFTAADAKRFYDRFGARQDIQFYENDAIDCLVEHADFDHASSVFELGCGTGRLAERLLRTLLPPSARYIGVDVSTTMVGLTRRRLAEWGDRVTVRAADGTLRWPEPMARATGSWRRTCSICSRSRPLRRCSAKRTGCSVQEARSA